MARNNILWLCSWYPGKTEPFNGDFIQRHARAAALYNDIYVLHAVEDGTEKLEQSTVEINNGQGLTEHIIYIKRKNSLLGKMISHYTWLKKMRQAIRSYITRYGKPSVVHVNVPMKAGILALWIKRKYKIPFVVTEHWGIYNDVEVHNYESRSNTFKHFTKQVFSKAAAFLSVSRYLAEGVNRLVLKKNFEVIPNVVDTTLFYYKEKPVSLFRFIHVSNMVPLKNPTGILNAFKKLQDKNISAELIMVGDTTADIRQYATRLGVLHVSFRGEVPYSQVAAEMQQADVMILFSNIENSPCVIGEALCCGVPVIATAVGGIPELIDATNAIQVEAGDEEQLAAAMEQMIHTYESFDRIKIAEDALRKFSYPVIGKKLDAVYASVD